MSRRWPSRWLPAIASKEADKAKKRAAAPPPPAVIVAEVVQKTVPIYSEFVAQTEAKETVEIRARVQAVLAAQHFTEGTVVKKGQLLFTLDQSEYKAKLLQAKADLDVTLARLGKAETDERRLKPLAERQAVPQQDYDNAVANLNAARAASRPPRPRVVEAELSLELLHDPLSHHRPDRQAPGGPGEPRRQGRGHAAGYRVERRSDARRRHHQRGGIPQVLAPAESGADRPSVRRWSWSWPTASVFPHKGKVVIVDRAVDLKTGTLSVVAEFPNPNAVLRPGQFGRVRAPIEVAENAILVPKRAVQEIQGVKSVLVVGADNVVALRTIRPAETVGEFLIVRDGVQPGERVIVEGIQKARPGSKVNPSTAPAGTLGRNADEKAARQKPAAKAEGK